MRQTTFARMGRAGLQPSLISESRPIQYFMRLIAFLFLISALFGHAGKPAEQDSPFDFSISAPQTWSVSELSVMSDAVKRLDNDTLKAILCSRLFRPQEPVS